MWEGEICESKAEGYVFEGFSRSNGIRALSRTSCGGTVVGLVGLL